MKRLTVLAIVLLTASAAACFPDGKDGAPGPVGPAGAENVAGGGAGDKPADPAAPGAASSSSGGETSSGGASSSSSSSGGTPPVATTKTGSIIVTQSSDGDTSSFSAVAAFLEVPTNATPPKSKCTITKEGTACELTACDVAGGNNPPAGEPKKVPSASDITITAAEAITLKADAKGLYTPKVGQSQLLTSAADFKIKAKGAEVPAFDKTVKAPSIVTVMTPEWTNPEDLFNVDRQLDLDFTWTDGTVGDVQVSITSIANDKLTTLACKFKANAGAGKIPQAALSKLIASETATIRLDGVTTQTFDQAGWKIDVTATSTGRPFFGGLASGPAGVR